MGRLVKYACFLSVFVNLMNVVVSATDVGDEQSHEMTSIEFNVEDEAGDPILDAKVTQYRLCYLRRLLHCPEPHDCHG